MEMLAEKLDTGWRCTFRDYSTRLKCNEKIEGMNDVADHMEAQHGVPRGEIVFDADGDVYRARETVTPGELQKAGAI